MKGQIYYGLAAIKGVGEKAAYDIIRHRKEGGPFESLEDFVRRVMGDLRTNVTKSHVEALIQAGAFDEFGDRAEMLWQMPHWAKWAIKMRQYAKFNAGITRGTIRKSYPPEPDFDEIAQKDPRPRPMSFSAKLRHEMELVGHCMSGHPMQGHEALAAFTEKLLGDDLGLKAPCSFLGYVYDLDLGLVRRGRNKGQEYARIEMLTTTGKRDDQTSGHITVIVWPNLLDRYRSLIHTGARLFVLAEDGQRPTAIVILTVDELLQDWVEWLVLHLDKEEDLRRIARLLGDQPAGDVETLLTYGDEAYEGPTISLTSARLRTLAGMASLSIC